MERQNEKLHVHKTGKELLMDKERHIDLRGGSRGGGLPKIGKHDFFWRKIVIFHTKYPKYFRASLRSAQLF
jgi:hypothetical protein